jgi:hypothetical protein
MNLLQEKLKVQVIRDAPEWLVIKVQHDDNVSKFILALLKPLPVPRDIRGGSRSEGGGIEGAHPSADEQELRMLASRHAVSLLQQTIPARLDGSERDACDYVSGKDSDFKIFDLYFLPVIDLGGCCAACASESRCKGFFFSADVGIAMASKYAAACWLKTTSEKHDISFSCSSCVFGTLHAQAMNSR